MKHYGLDEGKAFLRTVALTFRVFDRRYEERPLWRMRLNAGYDAVGSGAERPLWGKVSGSAPHPLQPSPQEKTKPRIGITTPKAG